MKTITILSGKGGVGKSSITASLGVLLARDNKIISADCDVDAPNLALCLGLKEDDFTSWEKQETSEKAELIEAKCTHCGKCRDVCKFNAIEWDEDKNIPVINRLMCEGCGVCSLVCPAGAITLKKVMNGRIGVGNTKYGFKVISGELEVGEAGSGKIVAAVKEKARKEGKDAEIMLVDSAAGIGCPVIASIVGSDYVIAVTEPTPSALSDVKRALETVEHFKIPCGIVINRWDINKEFSKKIEKFAAGAGIPVLAKIPYNRKFVDALVKLTPVVAYDTSLEKHFTEIIKKVVQAVEK